MVNSKKQRDLIVCGVVALVVLVLWAGGVFRGLESGLYDWSVRLTADWRTGDARIVIIAIDDTSLEALSRLRPAFREGGSVTAGNSSGLNDGAAALLVMEAETARRMGLRPMARLLSSAAVGVPPRVNGLGPVGATRKALERAGLSMEDIHLAERKEAFGV